MGDGQANEHANEHSTGQTDKHSNEHTDEAANDTANSTTTAARTDNKYYGRQNQIGADRFVYGTREQLDDNQPCESNLLLRRQRPTLDCQWCRNSVLSERRLSG